ncbi:VWA domain-containing protein [Methyloligella sp. 2.7D]|uniref:VWA domain-containing protein n=1 Tax=unclassified Methyloligella TaxID=2625955 RepID=UPI00157BE6F8|nr:VWA domain-containing protein [Methyloligella sp. GL2]QKP78065.1 VWA domain-containing protein [Methyloligella sp. GL2]
MLDLANRPAFRDPRFWLLAAALVCVAIGFILPKVRLNRQVYDIMAFVDITKSMNTRDVMVDGTPASRLEQIKQVLPRFVAGLPCQSRFGLGLFTERRVFVLYDPMEICENFSSIDSSIANLDWRMAWEGDSYVTKGVHAAIALTERLQSSLLFFTDGHEAPPLPHTGMPPFEGEPGKVQGLLVGVGGKSLSPMPKFDEEGREIGVYGPRDVLQESRFGVAPTDAKDRPGYHPRNAPFGAMPEGNEHLGQVKEKHLKEIAAQTGLSYAPMSSPDGLIDVFEAAASPREVVVATDIRPYPVALALVLLVISYGVLPLRDRIVRSLRQIHQSLTSRSAPGSRLTTNPEERKN